MDGMSHMPVSTKMQECIQQCHSCHDICLSSVSHCLGLGGEHAHPDHIRLLLDCAEICQTSANYMLRDSYLHPHTCGICAIICDQCADDCERFADDEIMQQCAQTCRSCAESCREMARGA